MKRVSVQCLCVALGLAMSASPTRADILNPSFEDLFDHWGGENPTGMFAWQARTDWASDGTWSMNLYSYTSGTFAVGDYIRMYQTVDLSGWGGMRFDVNLRGHLSGSRPFDHFKGAILIDGVEYWSTDVGGIHLDNTINVGSLTGPHTLEFRNENTEAGTFAPSYWTQWDHFQLVPAPSALWAGIIVLGDLAVARGLRRYAPALPHRHQRGDKPSLRCLAQRSS